MACSINLQTPAIVKQDIRDGSLLWINDGQVVTTISPHCGYSSK
jgi:hypothetical protein